MSHDHDHDHGPSSNGSRKTDATSKRIAVVVAHNPNDVIPLIPHFFGYQITESFVALGAERDTGVLTRGVCTDLPSEDEPTADRVTSLLDTLRSMADDGDIETFVLFGFGPEARVAPLMRDLLDAASRGLIRVLYAVRVEDSRYWIYGREPETGCAPEGHERSTGVTAAAALRLLGHPALPTREELIQQLRPDTGAPRAEMEAATDDARRWMATLGDTAEAGRVALRTAVARYQAGAWLSAQETARLSVLLDDPDVSDYAHRWIDPDRIQPYSELWMNMSRRAVDNLPTCLVLAAISRYLLGDGTLAGTAINEALTLEPGHPLAQMVAQQLGVGALPPRGVWRRLYREADEVYGNDIKGAE